MARVVSGGAHSWGQWSPEGPACHLASWQAAEPGRKLNHRVPQCERRLAQGLKSQIGAGVQPEASLGVPRGAHVCGGGLQDVGLPGEGHCRPVGGNCHVRPRAGAGGQSRPPTAPGA